MVINANHMLEERAVTLGIEGPGAVEILAGLNDNELVVEGNQAQLKAGQMVEPKFVSPADTKGEN
jgi:hypothetical protein